MAKKYWRKDKERQNVSLERHAVTNWQAKRGQRTVKEKKKKHKDKRRYGTAILRSHVYWLIIQSCKGQETRHSVTTTRGRQGTSSWGTRGYWGRGGQSWWRALLDGGQGRTMNKAASNKEEQIGALLNFIFSCPKYFQVCILLLSPFFL